MSTRFDRLRGACRLGRGAAWAALLSGPLLALAAGIGAGSRRLREAAKRWLHGEEHPVEVLAFVFLVTGGVLALARRLRWGGEASWARIFYLVFGLGLTLLAVPDACLDHGTIHPRRDYVFRICSEPRGC